MPGSENPYLAAPAGEVTVTVSLSEEGCIVDLDGWAGSTVKGFLARLSEGLGLDGCVSLELGARSTPYELGVYAAASAAAVYGVARLHGEKLSTLEVIEVARLADPEGLDPSWRVALESLRYTALEGRVAVYRNEEEHSILPQGPPAVSFGEARRAEARVSRDSVGTDVYGAIIHLMGVAVLEAAVRLKGGSGLRETIRALKPVHDAVAAGVWSLEPPDGDCIWAPDRPGYFRLLCFPRGEG